jgi:mycofactocin system glycosyltransferase
VAGRWQGGGVVQAGEERFARTLVQQGLLHPHFAGTYNCEEIDVIVPTFEDIASLRELLEQLAGFHVTVVDDDSLNANSVATCAQEFGATLLRLDRNQGPAHARNVAGVASTREFLWFVDDDVSMSSATHVAQRLRAAFADPLIAAVAPRVRGPEGPSIRERFEEHFSPLDMGERSGLVVPGGAIGYVPSACLMVRREAFGEGFDETLRVGEDVDFVWRLFDRGWLVRYDADVVINHQARATWRAWWRQRQGYGASSAELAQRHGERLASLRADPWTYLAWLSVLAGQPAWGARIVRSARNHARDRFFASADDPNRVANDVVVRNMVHAGGPLARGLVRTFGLVLLVAALHPRLRTRALSAFALGTAWRWRHQRLLATDLPLAIADDLAYGVGVVEGAWRAKSLRTLTPAVTKSSMGVREALGLASSKHRLD